MFYQRFTELVNQKTVILESCFQREIRPKCTFLPSITLLPFGGLACFVAL
jgi:hypothetical protein